MLLGLLLAADDDGDDDDDGGGDGDVLLLCNLLVLEIFTSAQACQVHPVTPAASILHWTNPESHGTLSDLKNC